MLNISKIYTIFKDFTYLFILQQILCFKAYFQQYCANTGKNQIRQVKILYFMEDGTIQVKEKSVDAIPLQNIMHFLIFNR